MKITESAVNVINEALKRTEKDYCHIGLFTRCHGNKSLDLRLIDKEEATNLVDLGSIKIDMTPEAVEFLKDFTMNGENGGILFIPPEGWSQPHSGEEGGCCGGHHHHHDGDGCCHQNNESEEKGCCEGEEDSCCCQNK